MLYEDVKVISKIICNLAKQNFVCSFRLVRYFILAPCYNLTMMIEFVFSFLPSYVSILFLANGKISKSIG